MSDLSLPMNSVSEPEPLSQFSMYLFMRLPAELQLEILSHCPQNDLVCLSLSSHALRALTLPLLPARPGLLSYDQTLPPEPLECTCGEKAMTGVAQNARVHRRLHHSYQWPLQPRAVYVPRGCHDYSPCRKYPPGHAVCKVARCTHCACTTCPLYVRLRGWMGDRKFCHDCRQFTKRPRSGKNKGRCLHGRPPFRRMPNNRWTYKKGLAYGRRWWRLWGTWGRDGWDYPRGDRTADISGRRNARVV